MVETVVEGVVALLVLAGSGFCVVSAIGVVRLQDAFIRMHANSKAGTLGCGLILLAVALYWRDDAITTRALAAIAFLLITAPVAAHMIGRAAYLAGTRRWPGTVIDELEGRYDRDRRELRS